MAYDGKSISFVKLVMDIMIGVVSKIRIMRMCKLVCTLADVCRAEHNL